MEAFFLAIVTTLMLMGTALGDGHDKEWENWTTEWPPIHAGASSYQCWMLPLLLVAFFVTRALRQ